MPLSVDDVLVQSPRAAGVEVVDGFVVYDPVVTMSHQLNPTAALVWQCLDGESPLGELIDDFTDAFDAPREAIEADVLGLAESLVESQLAVVGGVDATTASAASDDAPGDDPDAPIYLAEPPCGCLGAFEQIVWSATSTFRVGRSVFGIRSTDLGAHELVRKALAAYEIEDPEAVPYYALEVAAPPVPDDGLPFLALYLGRTARHRSRDTASLWDALQAELRRQAVTTEALVLDAMAVVGPRGALVGPRVVLSADGRAALDAAGLTLVPGPLFLDRATGELQWAAPELTLDGAAVEAFRSLLPAERTIELAPTPVVGWITYTEMSDPSQAGILVRALSLVANGDELGAAATLDVLGRTTAPEQVVCPMGEGLVDSIVGALVP